MNDNSNPAMVPDGTVGLITSAEIDSQIATARKWPNHSTRSQVSSVRKRIEELATLTPAIACECFYAIPRDGKMIEGPSARFAEIVATTWGNCRAGARVIAEERDHIVAQGMFHDLENNVAFSYEVKRRITDKNGNRYKADMVAVTGNAACSIALRNAVFKGVPRAYWADILDVVRSVAIGDAQTLPTRRAEAMSYLAKMGASEAMVLAMLGVTNTIDIGLDHLATLRGIATAIKEGDTTIEQAFAVEAKHAPSAESVASKVAASPPKKVTTATTLAPQSPEVVSKPAAADHDPDKGFVPFDGQAQAEAEVDADAADAAEPEEPQTILMPIGTDTQWIMPHQLASKPKCAGSVRVYYLRGVAIAEQWSGLAWRDYGDQEKAIVELQLALLRIITQHFKAKRIEREAALAMASTILKRDPPIATLKELNHDQLVELHRRLEVPASA